MTTKVLEKKLTDLQRRMKAVESKFNGGAGGGWRKIAGAAKDDQYFAEAMRLGAKWRKKANREDW